MVAAVVVAAVVAAVATATGTVAAAATAAAAGRGGDVLGAVLLPLLQGIALSAACHSQPSLGVPPVSLATEASAVQTRHLATTRMLQHLQLWRIEGATGCT